MTVHISSRKKPFLNFHTHRSLQDSRVFEVLCCPLPENGLAQCVGIHPWEVNEQDWQNQIAQLRIDQSVFMLGEMGLDKLKGAKFETQKKAFLAQLNLARQHNLACVLQTEVEKLFVTLPLRKTRLDITFLRDLSLAELEQMEESKLVRKDQRGNQSEFLVRQLEHTVHSSQKVSFLIPREGDMEHFQFDQQLSDGLQSRFYFTVDSVQ